MTSIRNKNPLEPLFEGLSSGAVSEALNESLYGISEKTGLYSLSLSGERSDYTISERVKAASDVILGCFESEIEKIPQLASSYYSILMKASEDFDLQNRKEETGVCEGAYKEALKIVNATESILSEDLRENIFQMLSKDGYTIKHLVTLLGTKPYQDTSIFHSRQKTQTEF
ncbi:MAG: hypothetical protein KAJ91_04630 [Candidatus Aenigmarchaeota archaeon]|nr:hypothetical protein [Candidatus Aenigmarchaeota archaeon]